MVDFAGTQIVTFGAQALRIEVRQRHAAAQLVVALEGRTIYADGYATDEVVTAAAVHRIATQIEASCSRRYCAVPVTEIEKMLRSSLQAAGVVLES